MGSQRESVNDLLESLLSLVEAPALPGQGGEIGYSVNDPGLYKPIGTLSIADQKHDEKLLQGKYKSLQNAMTVLSGFGEQLERTVKGLADLNSVASAAKYTLWELARVDDVHSDERAFKDALKRIEDGLSKLAAFKLKASWKRGYKEFKP